MNPVRTSGATAARGGRGLPPRPKRGTPGGSAYDRLRQLASHMCSDEGALTVGATGLVHEAVLRVPDDVHADLGSNEDSVRREMNRAVLDRARGRNALKRGGGAERDGGVDLDNVAAVDDQEGRDIEGIDLRRALDRLASFSPHLREVFRLRYELDLRETDVAGVLGVTTRTVRADALKARGLLGCFLGGGRSARAA